MRAKTNAVLVTSMMALVILMYPSYAFAVTPQNITTITPINEEISLQKTITIMSVPEENTLPWGTVYGSASDYVERYPVIIQFFKGEDPVHVAQVDVKGDGSYEYKFRVRSVDTDSGQVIDVFKGEYTVKIFKVVPNTNQQI